MARFSTVTPTTGFTYGPFLGRGGAGVGRHPGARAARSVARDWMPRPPRPPRAPHPPSFRGLGQSGDVEWMEPPAPRSKRKASKRKKRRPGKAVKCKNVTMKNGKKRRMCWDKHGMLTKSKSTSRRRGRSKKKGSR
jgi:hypothetical protein